MLRPAGREPVGEDPEDGADDAKTADRGTNEVTAADLRGAATKLRDGGPGY
jgi:hypothetical protein